MLNKKTLSLFLIFIFSTQISFAKLTTPKDEDCTGGIKGSLTGSVIAIGCVTNFGHNLNGSPDKDDNGITACRARNTRSGTHEKTGKPRDPQVCEIASLPASTLKEMFGSSNCSDFQGKKIKVCNQKTGQCAEYELWEKGPKEKLKKAGKIVDLTGCGEKKIGGNGNTPVYVYKI